MALCRDPASQGDDIPQGDNVRGLPAGTSLTQDGMDIIPEGCAWLDKAKLIYNRHTSRKLRIRFNPCIRYEIR
jgi:hypothetical protein